MPEKNNSASCKPAEGLCATCVHVRVVKSARSSRFLLCSLSETDPRFPKYPRLPVLSCPGYQKNL